MPPVLPAWMSEIFRLFFLEVLILLENKSHLLSVSVSLVKIGPEGSEIGQNKQTDND